jgi:hypothetical protein
VIIGAREERRVGHAERAEDPAREELVQTLPGDDLDDPAEHVGGDRVAPLAARLEQQRHRGELIADSRQVSASRRAPLEAAGAVDRVHRVVAHEAVGETGGVRQQVPDPDRLGGRHGLVADVAAAGEHPDVAERRDVPVERVGQLESAFLVEHHRRDGSDRLGHGVDAPQAVRLNGQPRLDVALPVGGHVRELAVPGDRDEPAGQLLLVHVAGEVPVDAVQSLLIESDLGRLDFGLQSAHRVSALRYFAARNL